jgi:hypothetical protein
MGSPRSPRNIDGVVLSFTFFSVFFSLFILEFVSAFGRLFLFVVERLWWGWVGSRSPSARTLKTEVELQRRIEKKWGRVVLGSATLLTRQYSSSDEFRGVRTWKHTHLTLGFGYDVIWIRWSDVR